jgi:exopolysaccharide biosynthesis polyprenyl glycosylphosphotransferase
MLKEYREALRNTFRLLDLLIIFSSFSVVYVLKRNGEAGTAVPAEQYQVLIVAYVVVWMYLSNHLRLYASKRVARILSEDLDVTKATTLCLLMACFPAALITKTQLNPIFLVQLWLLQTGILLVFRIVLRRTLRSVRKKGRNLRQVLIVGHNQRMERFVNKILESPEFGLSILGFIDAGSGKSRGGAIVRCDRLGELNSLEHILRTFVVDEVVILLPIKSFYSEIERILRTCERVGVEVKIPTDLFQLELAKSEIFMFEDLSLISLYTGPGTDWRRPVKRFVDVILSVLLLCLLWPLFILVAVSIKADSPGPVLFRQKRVGFNGRIFDCLKFRTMVENAEELKRNLRVLNEMDGPVFKMRNDPRVTRVGRFLRKTSIDELPQLVNVLAGHMSLVGPRPPVPDEVDKYELGDRRRLSVVPGITCLWQVEGRNTISFAQWMDLDRQYIDQWSLWLDFKILAKTIPAVLRRKGAA